MSIISEKFYRDYFLNIKLQSTKIILRTYSNEQLNVLGRITPTVEYDGKHYNGLHLYVINGEGVNLIGRDWLSVIRLKWNNLFDNYGKKSEYTCKLDEHDVRKPVCDKLSDILNKHAEIFNDELGTLKGMKAKLIVKENAKPKFCKARSVPFAYKEAVEKEIDRLEETGVIVLLQIRNGLAL